MSSKLFFAQLFFPVLLVSLAGTAQATRPDRRAFLAEKGDIERLAVERIHAVSADFDRVVVTAETRLSTLHEQYQVAGGTPPTRLDQDLGALRGACQSALRKRPGRPPPNAAAQELISRRWNIYREEYQALRTNVERQKREGLPENRIYWDSRQTFQSLRDRITLDILFNAPPKERSLAQALHRDEAALLMACEVGPKKTQAPNPTVVVPEVHAPTVPIDVQGFYRAMDQVPEAPSLRSGTLTVPPGARTVILRESGAKLVFRPTQGKGLAYVGQTDATPLQYGYLIIPLDTAYYFENIGPDPLALDFVGIQPQ